MKGDVLSCRLKEVILVKQVKRKKLQSVKLRYKKTEYW
jgi:hypothetical protein